MRWILLYFACLSCSGSQTRSIAERIDQADVTAVKTAEALPGGPKYLIRTSLGDVTVELFDKAAPVTVRNFQSYAEKSHYNGTLFHRVIPDFMIQGGGFDVNLAERSTSDPIQNEAGNGLANQRGTLAMARTNDPHSAASQFFINLKNNPFLNFRSRSDSEWGYCVFGKVLAGMDVVDNIAIVKTESRGEFENIPVDPVMINKIESVP